MCINILNYIIRINYRIKYRLGSAYINLVGIKIFYIFIDQSRKLSSKWYLKKAIYALSPFICF